MIQIKCRGSKDSRKALQYDLSGTFFDKVKQSEDLLEEDVVLRAGLGPLIELIHQLDMAGEVVNGLHLL